jgi:hypothetical protein
MKKSVIACIVAFILGAGIVALVFLILPDRSVEPVQVTEEQRLDRLFIQSLDEQNETIYKAWKKDQSKEFKKIDSLLFCVVVSSLASNVSRNHLTEYHSIQEQIEENERMVQKYGQPVFGSLAYEIILDAYDSLNPAFVDRLDWDASDNFAKKWQVRCLRAFREGKP